MSTIELVREFHKTFGHPVALAPTAIGPHLLKLRLDLIAEEFKELGVALGADIQISIHIDPNKAQDIVEAADALADLDVVVTGTSLVMGIPHDQCVREVHRANMSKAGEDGKPILRADGKILKGPNYTPPDIETIICAALENKPINTMMRVRFKANGQDYRPVEWPVKHPFWCSGYSNDGDNAIMIAYADDLAEIQRLWPESSDFDVIEADILAGHYKFNDRFPMPAWFSIKT